MTAVPSRIADALRDGYRLERELGSGGMATVYLAEDLKHHREVAVKVLRPDDRGKAGSLGAIRYPLSAIRYPLSAIRCVGSQISSSVTPQVFGERSSR